MSRHNVMIFHSMRPPVAAEQGNTPLRTKDANQVFRLVNSKFQDRSGQRVTKEQVVMNYTDGGAL